MSVMYSQSLKSALENEVVGQPGAINMIVRGVTRAAGGLASRPTPLCTFLLMGPSGTGRSHVARALCRTLHGDESVFVAADCTSIGNADPWTSFAVQLMPLFQAHSGPRPSMPPGFGPPSPTPGLSAMPTVERTFTAGMQAPGPTASPFSRGHVAIAQAPPFSVLVIGDLERGRPEFGMMLIRSLRTGHVPLPDGRTGSLQNCVVFLTSSLCADEILSEKPGIGFSAAREAEEARAHTFKLCTDAALKHWGIDLIAQLDDLIVFHRLEEAHLVEISQRLVAQLNRRIASRGFRCELTDSGARFLLQRGMRDPRMGARCLVRAHRKHLEFPVADLAMSGRVPEGGVVRIGWKEGDEHLHFDVEEPAEEPRLADVSIR